MNPDFNEWHFRFWAKALFCYIIPRAKARGYSAKACNILDKNHRNLIAIIKTIL